MSGSALIQSRLSALSSVVRTGFRPRWATENGTLSGSGILAPQGQAIRAQVAQMLMNYLKK